MATVRELITKIGFDVDERAINKFEGTISRVKAGIHALIAALAIEKVASFFESAAQHSDELEKSAQRMGLSVEQVQKLGYAAKLGDIEFGKFTQTMGIFSKRLIAAADGSKEAGDAFKTVGVDPKKSGDQLQALLKISDTFSKMEDGSKKTALAMDLFGKSGGEMVPFLNQGSEAIRAQFEEAEALNVVLGDDAVAAGGKFDNQIKRMSAFVQGLGLNFASKLFPALNRVTDGMIEWAKANKDLINTRIEQFANIVGFAFETLGTVFETLADTVKFLWMIWKPFASWLVGGEGNAKIFTAAIIGLGVAIRFLGGPLTWITTLIAGISLAYDDVKAYIEGRPSLLGAVIDWFHKAWPQFIEWLQQSWEGFKQFFMNLWTLLLTWLGGIWGSIKQGIHDAFYGALDAVEKKLITILGYFKKIASFAGFKSMQDINFGALVKGPPINISEQDQKAFLNSLDNSNNLLNGVPSVGMPGTALGGPIANTTTENNDYNINTKVDVNIDGSQDPVQQGQIIADTVREEMGKQVGIAQRSTQAGTVN